MMNQLNPKLGIQLDFSPLLYLQNSQGRMNENRMEERMDDEPKRKSR